MLREFLAFLKQYGVIGLAIAVIIGGKLNELVGSLVNDVLMPVLFQPVLQMTKVDSVRELSFNGIFYGKFLGSLIDFTVVAFVVFFLAKKVLRDETALKK